MFALIVRHGPNLGIDFKGGIIMQISLHNNYNVTLNDIRDIIRKHGVKSFEIQNLENSIILKIKKMNKLQEEFNILEAIKNSIQLKFINNSVIIEKIDYVGPTIGKFFLKQAIYSFLFAIVGIIVYVSFRFKSNLWGLFAIVGIIHDVIISFGFIVLANKEINMIVIVALLTIAGYSINDTIVLFDRIKENLKFHKNLDIKTVINKSINEILTRTIITSLMVLIVACSLFILGGEVIHTFSYVMIIGTILGVFSSIFICSQLIYEYEKTKQL
jgi:preprotein translocase subunit SecF